MDWSPNNDFCNTKLVDRIVPGFPKDYGFRFEEKTGFQRPLASDGRALSSPWAIEAREREELFPMDQQV